MLTRVMFFALLNNKQFSISYDTCGEKNISSGQSLISIVLTTRAFYALLIDLIS